MPKQIRDASKIVDDIIAGAPSKVERVIDGINAMTETPGAAAKKKKEKYRQNVLAALADGTWDAGHDSYTLSDFQQRATTKVRDRWVSGLTEARERTIAAREDLNAYQQAIRNKVAGMKDITDADNNARMQYNLDQMRKYKGKRRRK
jgi:hypothetical protein